YLCCACAHLRGHGCATRRTRFYLSAGRYPSTDNCTTRRADVYQTSYCTTLCLSPAIAAYIASVRFRKSAEPLLRLMNACTTAATQHGAGADAAARPKIVRILRTGTSPIVFPIYRAARLSAKPVGPHSA